MINNLPVIINIVFGLTTLLTVYLFYKATNHSKTTLAIIIVWLLLQAILGWKGFYTVTDTFPPRFALLALPALLFIAGLFLSAKGRTYLDSLDTKALTLLHIVRIPVELTLYWLFIHKAIPQLMTFEGRNFDILSGITAPVVFYFGYVKNRFNKTILICWNLVCLGLLANIVINAILSAPTPFQQFAFDQPNIAILYFPFVWLPCCVVPLVLLAHLATIRKLLKR
ncbi:MAG: hypothetical protein ABI666_08425 [Ferruginibacter sp.]